MLKYKQHDALILEATIHGVHLWDGDDNGRFIHRTLEKGTQIVVNMAWEDKSQYVMCTEVEEKLWYFMVNEKIEDNLTKA